MNGLKVISPEFKSGFRSHARNSYESVFIFQVREKKREREGKAEIGKKDKARRNERKVRERPEHSVTDAFTHFLILRVPEPRRLRTRCYYRQVGWCRGWSPCPTHLHIIAVGG